MIGCCRLLIPLAPLWFGLILPAGASADRPNILFIAVDDLRTELACYGDAHIHSPHIDALSESGRRFERAYCQQSVCNPSRTSLMTGLRPDAIEVTGNHVHFRSKRPDVVTLSQHFMRHGYHAQSIGKIYHGVFPDGASKTTWDTMGDPQSWSVPTTRFGPRYYYTEAGIEQAKQSFAAMYRPKDPQDDDWTKKLVFGPMTEAPDVDDETLYDGKVAAAAVDTLHELKKAGKPFFLAVGFIKPHTPFIAPKKYWDLYDPEKIELATRTTLPDRAPTLAGHGSGEIRRYTDQPNRGEISKANRRRMKHGYFACISYVDAQIGKLLRALKAEGLQENTIVVLFSDHGYHLGEHGLWGKTTNFELDTRVPLIIRIPDMKTPGEPTRSLAELVDLYPTLSELAGLPIPQHVQGTSLAPVVASPAASPDDIAISQFPRGGNADTGGKTMGYSLRTDRWRFTEWINRDTGEAVARELYDHADDNAAEVKSLAGSQEHDSIVDQLTQRLRKERESANRSEQTTRLELPRVFGSHMVLQADAELPVWGTTKPGGDVLLQLGTERMITTADGQGNWQVQFSPRKATTTPTSLSIQSNDQQLTLEDILIGEVWVCAGQSNMEFPLSSSSSGAEELSAANHPHLRLLNLVGGARGSSGSYTSEHLARLTPETFCEGEWKVASSESAQSFSAVGWYFGRQLQSDLDVPVGLICPAVGGTPTEAWIPRDVLKADPELKGLVAGNWLENDLLGEFCRERGLHNLRHATDANEQIPGDELGPNHSFKPGFMWQAGIKPLIPFAIRGAIWYQGESNAESPMRVSQHGRLFPMMVNQWRANWRQGDFPFLFVQLPALNRPAWPSFRDQQRRMLDEIDNVAMAITIDTGHPTNVHPTTKKPVGQRLARLALQRTYKLQTDATSSGPLLVDAKRNGDSFVVNFNHVGSGLRTTDGQPPRYFEVCGDDGIFHPAIAKIVKANTVVAKSPKVAEPEHVRYAWLPYPDPPVNLVNRDSLPASPFSTRDETKHSRPNILLIVGEDHGCELSCYGDPVIETPHLDRLAAQGILFENGYVTQSVCSPSRSTIFTGLYPHQNGQLGLATHQFGWFTKWPTTYSLLKGAGYRTGLIGKTHVIPADAVESFVDFRFQEKSNFSKKGVADYAIKAGEFFRDSDEPFFMTVNYPDAHWPLQGQVDGLPETQVDPAKIKVMPYVGDETPRMRKVVQNYYDCMLRLDACVGQLVKQLADSGKADNTLVIFIGDHGAQMARGKVTVYEGGMRVPYIARWPGVIAAGKRSKALVSTIDLLPTFVTAANVKPPRGLPGRSLRPIFEGTVGDDFRQYVACERNCDAAHITFPQRTIRDARYKLIHSPVRDREDPAARYYRIHGASHWAGSLTDEELEGASEKTKSGYARWLSPPEFQLYDLQNDPHEWNDLANDAAHGKTKQRLLNALKQWQSDTNDPLADPVKLRMLMDETDQLNVAKQRSPKEGWQYLKYLRPAGTANAAEPPADVLFETSFEVGKASQFAKRSEGDVVLQATGTVSITTKFARSGKQCLRMLGDADNTLTFTLSPKLRSLKGISFHAERWTKREPFAFSVEVKQKGQWRELAELDHVVAVGARFLSHVRIPVSGDGETTAIRFRAKSAGEAGLLIDDLAFLATPPLQPTSTEQAMLPSEPLNLVHSEALFVSGTHNTHTFRIPAIVTATNGDLIAACDARRTGPKDLVHQRTIDIVFRRSEDNGKTWSSIETLDPIDDGGCSDPSMLVDSVTGDIFCFYNYMASDLSSKEYRFKVQKSSDHGKTWSKPIDFTDQVAGPELKDSFKFITSGRGIQTRDGSLIHNFVRVGAGATLFSSPDHGASWKALAEVRPGDESKVVQLPNGSLMVNSRHAAGKRFVHQSNDGGKNWSSAEFSLPDPRCNASIIQYTARRDGYTRDRLVFCNAASNNGRKNLAVRISYDGGASWSDGKVIDAGPSAYSEITILNDGSFGVLYEPGYKECRFVRFTLDALTDGRDRLNKPYRR